MTWTESQFDGFFRDVYPRVLRSSHLLLGDRAAAEDVAQEAFARLLARQGLPFPDAERWVFKVARNLGISRLRAVKRTLPLSDALAMDGWEMGEEAERRALLLSHAVRALPARQQEVVAMRIYGELSYEAIARATGRTLGAIKQELHRARLALTAKLNGTLAEADDAW
ncbi:MAG TPA: sigma-70 family RNA polymerase sigma factor [Gemmatimonadales bacterium]|jgi:RNA polymerase sigma-70 factor (ECF subfamily)